MSSQFQTQTWSDYVLLAFPESELCIREQTLAVSLPPHSRYLPLLGSSSAWDD